MRVSAFVVEFARDSDKTFNLSTCKWFNHTSTTTKKCHTKYRKL